MKNQSKITMNIKSSIHITKKKNIVWPTQNPLIVNTNAIAHSYHAAGFLVCEKHIHQMSIENMCTVGYNVCSHTQMFSNHFGCFAH